MKIYNHLKFKLRSSTKGRVYVKICNGSTVILESWAPSYGFMPEAATRTECVQDIASISNQSFDKIEINASVDNEAVASVYIDDILLAHASSANGESGINVTISHCFRIRTAIKRNHGFFQSFCKFDPN